MANLLVVLLPLLAAPGPDAAPPLPPTPELPSYGGLLLRTLVALLVVLVLAWVLLRWGLRRLLPGGASPGPLRVLARAPLDGRRAVVLVEAAGRYLVLGVGEASVTLLLELEPEAVKGALAASTAARPGRFAEVLRERLGRSGARATPAPPPDAGPAEDAAGREVADASDPAAQTTPKPDRRRGDA